MRWKGDTFLFWSDKWLFDGSSTPLAERFPRLHSFVIDPKLTAEEVYECQDFTELFHLPLPVQAYPEMQDLSSAMRLNPLLVANDTWIYSWALPILLQDIINIYMLI
jgi:hypothetical protein